MNPSIIVSTVFFVCFIYCLMMGLYIISLNDKNTLNRMFLIISAAISLWLFSFTIANSAGNHEMLLFWRRFSVLGWGLVYAYVLHYFIILTGKNRSGIKPRLLLLIYLPALFVVYLFCISPMAPSRYEFVNTTLGWVNTSGFKPEDLVFTLYYIGYIAISMYLVYKWGWKSKKKNNKKQARLIIVSFTAAIILGTITDIIINKQTNLRVPQLAPVMAMIPLTSIFYCIKRYGLMEIPKGRRAEPGMILSEYHLSRYYKVVSTTYILGSLAYFIMQYYFQKSPMGIRTSDIMLSIGSAYFITGIIIWLITVFIKKDKLRDIIFIIVVSMSIPAITILFAPPGNTTVWVLPTLLIMLSIVYNKKILLYTLGASNIVTQIYVWIDNPRIMVQINSAEYITRVFFIFIFIVISFYIHRVYLYRLKENENKVKLQNMVAKISAQFTTATNDNIDNKIFDMLKTSGSFFNADRAFVYLFSKKKITHEWCADNRTGILGEFSNFMEDFKYEWDNRKINNTLIEIPDVEVIPDANGNGKTLLKKNDMKTLFILPLKKKNEYIGLIAYGFDRNLMKWRQGDQEILEIMMNIMSDTLARLKSEEDIIYLAYHDVLTDLPNKRYFDEYMSKVLKKDRKNKKAVLLLNYKKFTLINLTFGYDYANNMIKKTASRLKEFCSEKAELFHISIDRFVLFIDDYNCRTELEDLCSRIMESLHYTISNKIVNGNIGVVEINQSDADSETLLKHASIAADSVEDNELWGYSFFSEKMASALNRKSQIEIELRNIINKRKKDSEVYLLYQPIIDLKTDKIVSFEALARMKSKKYDIISPLEFIEIAEETHQIYMLGDLIICKAFDFIKTLLSKGLNETRVMVNISALQILRDKFISDLFARIAEYKINPSLFGIELTESVFSNDYMVLNDKFKKLKDKGIKIAIDDFGTGYSSFARESELSIDSLKIDKYFIDKLLKIKPEQAITSNIIAMAHKMGHTTVAEGVENNSQKQYLIKHNCDFMQGYLYSKPVAPEKAIEMLEEEKNKDFGRVM